LERYIPALARERGSQTEAGLRDRGRTANPGCVRPDPDTSLGFPGEPAEWAPVRPACLQHSDVSLAQGANPRLLPAGWILVSMRGFYVRHCVARRTEGTPSGPGDDPAPSARNSSRSRPGLHYYHRMV